MRPRAGAGEIEIGKGKLLITEDGNVSNRSPQDGVTVEPEAAFSEKQAKAKPITLAVLRGYTTWDGRKGRKRERPSNPERSSTSRTGREGRKPSFSTLTPVRRMRSPVGGQSARMNRIGTCAMGSIVIESDMNPGRFFGIERLSFDGTTFVRKSGEQKMSKSGKAKRQEPEGAKRKAAGAGISIEDCSVVLDRYAVRSE